VSVCGGLRRVVLIFFSSELNNRASFIDFCQGLLNLNPVERWNTATSEATSIYHGRKVHEALVGKLTRINRS
jgi:hypothetical protein